MILIVIGIIDDYDDEDDVDGDDGDNHEDGNNTWEHDKGKRQPPHMRAP